MIITTSPIWIPANYYGLAYSIFSCLLTRLWQEFWVPQLWCNYYYQDTALKIAIISVMVHINCQKQNTFYTIGQEQME